MKTIFRGAALGSLMPSVSVCTGSPVVLNPLGKAELAAENSEICVQHAKMLNNPLQTAQVRANVIKDMQNRKCPNTPAEWHFLSFAHRGSVGRCRSGFVATSTTPSRFRRRHRVCLAHAHAWRRGLAVQRSNVASWRFAAPTHFSSQLRLSSQARPQESPGRLQVAAHRRAAGGLVVAVQRVRCASLAQS